MGILCHNLVFITVRTDWLLLPAEWLPWFACLSSYLMLLVSITGTKVKLSQPLPPQLVSGPGHLIDNHSHWEH